MQKKLSLLITLICICCTFTSCYDAREIDDEVYALAIGIDKGSTDRIRFTIEYPNYKSGGGSDSKDNKSKTQEGGSNIHIIESPTILEGLEMFGMSVSRRVSLMHVKVLIISEEFAREGVNDIVTPLERYYENRGTMNVIVSKGSAENFIKENITNIGSSIAKSIELIIQQSYYSNSFPRERFLTFYRTMCTDYGQPIATYGGVNDFIRLLQSGKRSQGVAEKGYLPGELAREGSIKREIVGAAVFNKDKMVGYLDSYEFGYLQLILGKYTNGDFSIEDKNAPGKAIVISLKNSRNTSVKTSFEDGKPVLYVDVKVEGDLEAIQSGIEYESIDYIENLNKQVEDFLLKGMKKIVDKTQNEFRSDIFGFGRYIAGHFATIKEWEEYNWLEHYPEAKVNIKVEVNIRRTGVLIGSKKLGAGKKTGMEK